MQRVDCPGHADAGRSRVSGRGRAWWRGVSEAVALICRRTRSALARHDPPPSALPPGRPLVPPPGLPRQPAVTWLPRPPLPVTKQKHPPSARGTGRGRCPSGCRVRRGRVSGTALRAARAQAMGLCPFLGGFPFLWPNLFLKGLDPLFEFKESCNVHLKGHSSITSSRRPWLRCPPAAVAPTP